MFSENEKERVRLVELDLAETNNFLKGVVGSGATIRSAALTVWLALIGFSLQQGLWELSFLATVVAALFWVLDGYHGWLYSEASKHVRSLEMLLSTYYDALSRGEDNESVILDFQARLRAHRFGLFLTLRESFDPVTDVWSARPRVIYRLLYPFLVIIALATSFLISSGIFGVAQP